MPARLSGAGLHLRANVRERQHLIQCSRTWPQDRRPISARPTPRQRGGPAPLGQTLQRLTQQPFRPTGPRWGGCRRSRPIRPGRPPCGRHTSSANKPSDGYTKRISVRPSEFIPTGSTNEATVAPVQPRGNVVLGEQCRKRSARSVLRGGIRGTRVGPEACHGQGAPRWSGRRQGAP